jgi:nucleotide-binding universal stress UspA family protein
MIRSLLVPLDGSAFAEHALPLALAIARRAGAEVHLVRVYEPIAYVYPNGFAVPEVDNSLLQEARAYLDTVAGRVAQATGMPVRTEVLEGDIAIGLEKRAAGHADLVVMTTHGRGALGQFWLGSVAGELVRHLPMPVLLARPGDGLPDLIHEPPFRRILIPLDGTPLAEQIIEPAVALGALCAATYTLVQVVKPLLPVYDGLAGDTLAETVRAVQERTEAFQRQQVEAAERYLTGVAGRLRDRGLAVETRVVVAEHRAAGVFEVAREVSADLIALATHGRRTLARLVLGSVADKVIRGGPCPVLVLRPRL